MSPQSEVSLLLTLGGVAIHIFPALIFIQKMYSLLTFSFCTASMCLDSCRQGRSTKAWVLHVFILYDPPPTPYTLLFIETAFLTWGLYSLLCSAAPGCSSSLFPFFSFKEIQPGQISRFDSHLMPWNHKMHGTVDSLHHAVTLWQQINCIILRINSASRLTQVSTWEQTLYMKERPVSVH